MLYAVVGAWVVLTLVVYGTIVYASFVKLFTERKALTDDVKAGLTQLLTEFKKTFKPES